MPRVSRHHRRSHAKGQSLVEFVLALPILTLIIAAVGTMAIGTYQAHMASDAIREPALRKMVMASTDGAIGTGTLAGYANGSPQQGTLRIGSLVDSVSITNVDQYTSVIVGNKRFNPPVPIIPGFNIRVGQIMNRNLLQSASNGATARPYGTPWVPGDVPVVPPWEGAVVLSPTTTEPATTEPPPATTTAPEAL